jgi:cytochrome c oxidase subunit 2
VIQSPVPQTWVGHETVLGPSSPPAHAVWGLFTFQWIVATIVYVIVIATLIYAVVRARRREAGDMYASDPLLGKWVGGGVIATIVILFAYLLYDFGVGRAVAAPLREPHPLHISITGHQWWWDVHYEDTVPQHQLTTANEIHVPTGRPVLFTLNSTDVIHSFWVPNLNGKRDLIPGHPNDAWFQADTPGVYRGQCAEFCGLEHAKMAIVVVAQSPADYERWYASQLQPAKAPVDSVSKAGQQVFMAGPCAMCHAIGGTPAGAHLGPDLTHVGSRLTLAAGVLPNTRANMAGWIVDPQSIKPGSNMPSNNLSPADLRALLNYLEGLK